MSLSSFPQGSSPIRPQQDSEELRSIIAVHRSGDLAKAETLYQEYLKTHPQSLNAWLNLAHVYFNTRQLSKAFYPVHQALSLDPLNARAYNLLGIIFASENKYQHAIAAFELGLCCDESNKDLYRGLWQIYETACKDDEAALAVRRRYLKVYPDDGRVLSELVNRSRSMFMYRELDSDIAHIRRLIETDNGSVKLFPLLSLFTDRALLKRAAINHYRALNPENKSIPRPRKQSKAGDKIRVGYMSGDVGDHPVSYITAHFYRSHKRNEFEIYAYAMNSPKDNDFYRYIMQTADKSYSLHDMELERAVSLLKEHNLDIMVDLNGYTGAADMRQQQLLWRRPAGAIINYLGFMGTLGTDYHDYILADRYLIPEEHQVDYTEQVLYVDCLFAYRSMFAPCEQGLGRSDFGLPEDGFIFAVFHRGNKISNVIFEAWMRILRSCPGSYFWMRSDSDTFRENLLRAASERGVTADRFIFHGKDPIPRYQARYKIAGLVLDAYPYNGGYTSTDALFHGCPLLTLRGETMMGRVGGSLLTAIGYDDFIVNTIDEYVDKAIDFVAKSENLPSIREELIRRARSSKLFDGDNMVLQLEQHYRDIVNKPKND